MRLQDGDIRTREVLGWNGLHLFNFSQSSCSQKLRIFLDLKQISWTSHKIDLLVNENITAWFLGINPRGLVPVLVHDGAVHIESNDILLYLERLHPTPRLIPLGGEANIGALLKHEDDLHFDLRNLTFRFVFAPPETPKSNEVLQTYATAGSGLVGGRRDPGLVEQLDWWHRYIADGGISDDVVHKSAQRFRVAFDELEARLDKNEFVFGDELTIVDIAWFIYVERLTHAGYPFARLHPRVMAWFAARCEQPAFARERATSRHLEKHVAAVRQAQGSQTLEALGAL